MKKKNQIIRFNWETELQYKYRLETGEIFGSVGVILGNLEAIQKQDPEKITIVESLRKLKNKLNSLIVPEMYTNIHELITNCINCYYDASKKLVESLKIKDTALAIQAGRLIEKGTCWMKIAKAEIFEIVEKKEKENFKN